MGSGRHPPSEIYSKWFGRRIAMQARSPVHVWAMLSRGREAEVVEVEQVGPSSSGSIVKGVGRCERWRECDGERDWERKGMGGPRQQWTAYLVQRMRWVRRDGVLQGEWEWEEYDRDKEWDDSLDPDRPRDERNTSLFRSSALVGSVPQEVLLGMVRQLEIVSTYFRSMTLCTQNSFVRVGSARDSLPPVGSVVRGAQYVGPTSTARSMSTRSASGSLSETCPSQAATSLNTLKSCEFADRSRGWRSRSC